MVAGEEAQRQRLAGDASQVHHLPLRGERRQEGAANVLDRTLFQSSQICHHPVLHGKKETHLCRGQRDEQLELLFRMGWIEEPTDAAFAKRSRDLGVTA